MIREKKKGMWLEYGSHLQTGSSGWMIHTVSAVLAYCMLTLVFMELTRFGELYEPWKLFLTGTGICLLYGIALRFQKQNWIYPLVLLFLLISVLFFREQILEGGRLFWNHLGDIWTVNTGWVLPELKMKLEETQQSRCLFWFSAVPGVSGALLCCVLTKKKWPAAAVLVSGFTLAGMLLFCRKSAFEYLPFILVISVFLLVSSGWEKKRMPRFTFGIWMLLAAAGLFLTSGRILDKTEKWASEISSLVHKELHKHRFETEDSVLPEGDLANITAEGRTAVNAENLNGEAQNDETQNGEMDIEKEPDLLVTMEKPEAMYLRGYTGAVFEKDQWSVLDKRVLADSEKLLYWLNLKAFDVRTQFESAVLSEDADTNFVTVQNTGACSRYYYVPFSLSSADFLYAENLDPDMVLSDGERNYAFSAVSDSNERIGKILEDLQNEEDEEILNYRKAESAYREFVYGNYLQIPEDTKERYAGQWNQIAAEHGDSLEELTTEQAQECVRDFLEQYLTEGSSYQYATTAVLTLRYFGFPARYAEGYVITEEMVSDVEEGTAIEVDSSSAGAWPEVYQDGIGWIPLELTADINRSSGEKTQKKQKKKTGSRKEDSSEETKEKEQEETQSELPEETDDQMKVPLPDLLNWKSLLAVPILLLLLILVLIIRRKMLLSRKEKKFHSDDPKEAIAFIFADTATLLEKLELDRGNGSMRVLCDPVRQRFGEAYADSFEKMIYLNAQAVFSSRSMTEEQRETALEFRKMTLKNLKEETRWFRRWCLKWLQCLY